MTDTNAPREQLVELLKTAAKLEHCLLDAYLYAACSIKSMPQEWAEAQPGVENRRRAIQFERARGWKQNLLKVAQEEMIHLHYVQCMLRALGERPCFDLPKRSADGDWVFPSWQARVSGEVVDDGRGVTIPVSPLTDASIRQFVLYESTDAIQDDEWAAAAELFARLQAFEQEFLLETMLLGVDAAPERGELKTQLATLYASLSPVEGGSSLDAAALAAVPQPPRAEVPRFQSIADFYYQGVLPLYQQAFDQGWVRYDNDRLNAELQEQAAAEGFIPSLLKGHSRNFEKPKVPVYEQPLAGYKTVQEMIESIVEQGEGLPDFRRRAEAMLRDVEQRSVRTYAEVAAGRTAADGQWFNEAQMLRRSHLYRFAIVMTQMQHEQAVCRSAAVPFAAQRDALEATGVPLRKFVDELPAQYNACYLVLVAWLARIYEVDAWGADEKRREAIEGLATWPLMSMAIRPMLELATFFSVDRARLFRTDAAALPSLPTHAQQLLVVYQGPERSEAVNERIDYLAVRALADVGAWAAKQREVVQAAASEALGGENRRKMLLARLADLSDLGEFKRQLDYRIAGGYSNNGPDQLFRWRHPDGSAYEEQPARTAAPLFEDSLVMRLRFAGNGIVQLATDPDPPSDEVGCSGTIMMHAADGDRRFDRSLVWSDNDPAHTVRRPPADSLPPFGVPIVDATLMAGAKVLGSLKATGEVTSTGAVQTSGGQNRLEVIGLDEVVRVPSAHLPAGLGVELLTKDGVWPFLNGQNHLIWRDGEPIDPFIVGVRRAEVPGAPGGSLLMQREIFNEGKTILEMTPYQRTMSGRGPTGFDFNITDVPDWARGRLSPAQRALLQSGDPMAYLEERGQTLVRALRAALDANDGSQRGVDAVISLAERSRLTLAPKGTTVGWLAVALDYGHTVSGTMHAEGAQELLGPLSEAACIPLGIATAQRGATNGRWVMSYSLGAMDTDSLTNLVFGELYVPLVVRGKPPGPVRNRFAWTLPGASLASVHAYGCDFARPFWANFEVDGRTRTTQVSGRKGEPITITETLQRSDDAGYAYTMTGLESYGVTEYEGSFRAKPDGAGVGLSWSTAFHSSAPDDLAFVLSIVAGARRTMGSALAGHFAPRATATKPSDD